MFFGRSRRRTTRSHNSHLNLCTYGHHCTHASNQNNRKKYEIATDEVGNPIKQDEKKGKLREFKKGDIFFNYGCLPVSYCILLFLQHMLCLIGS